MCFVFEVYGDERAREVRAGRCAWRATLTGTYVSVRGIESSEILSDSSLAVDAGYLFLGPFAKLMMSLLPECDGMESSPSLPLRSRRLMTSSR